VSPEQRGRGQSGSVAEQWKLVPDRPGLHPPHPPIHPPPHPPPHPQSGNLLYEYDAAYIDARYEVFDLRVVHRRRRTGFEDSKEFPIRRNDLIAGRYQVRWGGAAGVRVCVFVGLEGAAASWLGWC